jgi:RimJ/RimL family protein N-acetyltransferase
VIGAVAAADIEAETPIRAEQLRESEGATGLCLRLARPEDRDLVLTWANDPGTRAGSFSSAPIARDEHGRWWEGLMADPARHLLVAELAGRPVGQIRLTRTEPAAFEVGITVAPAERGRGLAVRILRAGAAEARARGAERLLARIRPENVASVRAFERAGYCLTGSDVVNGQPALCLSADLTGSGAGGEGNEVRDDEPATPLDPGGDGPAGPPADAP